MVAFWDDTQRFPSLKVLLPPSPILLLRQHHAPILYKPSSIKVNPSLLRLGSSEEASPHPFPRHLPSRVPRASLGFGLCGSPLESLSTRAPLFLVLCTHWRWRRVILLPAASPPVEKTKPLLSFPMSRGDTHILLRQVLFPSLGLFCVPLLSPLQGL